MSHSILRVAPKWQTTASACVTQRVPCQTAALCSLRHSENAPLQGLCRQSTLILWISLGRGDMSSGRLCPILTYQRDSPGLSLFIRCRVRVTSEEGCLWVCSCGWRGALKQPLQGLVSRWMWLRPCQKLTRAQLTAALTSRQQPSNLKSLPQFSAPVKTPALMMDVASLCEPMVGWHVLCEIGKSDLSVSMLVFFQCVNSYLVKAAVSVCHRFYTIYQTSHSILKCFDRACNGVFISTIKNVVSDMLFWG